MACVLGKAWVAPRLLGVATVAFSAGQFADGHLVASATLNVGQQIGASIGTSLLNSIFAAAVTAYLTAHLASARLIGRQALTGQALLHGYTTAFWWTAGILAGGAVICGALIRSGPLAQPGTPSPARGAAPAQAEAEAGPGVPASQRPGVTRRVPDGTRSDPGIIRTGPKKSQPHAQRTTNKAPPGNRAVFWGWDVAWGFPGWPSGTRG